MTKDTHTPELEACQVKMQEYLDGWKRTQANFINYKKDESKRMAEFSKFAATDVLLNVIEALDAIHLTLQHTPESLRTEHKNWFDGLQHSLKKFEDILKKYEVEKIEVGDTLDPLYHEVVQDARPPDGEGTIVEVQAGYTLHGRVLRPARVKITQ